MKKRFLFLLQTTVTLGLLGWIFAQPEIRENTGVVLRQADLCWVVAAVLVAGAETWCGVLRWRIFLKMLAVQLSWWETVRLFYLGLFFNTFLVGSVGGDAVKALALMGQGQPRGPALLSVVLDRLSGLAALMLTVALFLVWHYDWLCSSALVSGMVHFVILYLVVVVALLVASLAAAWSGHGDRAPHWLPYREEFSRLCAMYFLFARRWPQTLLSIGLSCAMLLGYFLVFYCAMRAYGMHPGLTQVFAFMPTVDVISALPISLGGVGVREKLFTVLLGELFGVAASKAVCISLTGFLATLIWGVIGLIVLPFYRGWLHRERALEAQTTPAEPGLSRAGGYPRGDRPTRPAPSRTCGRPYQPLAASGIAPRPPQSERF